MIDVMLITLATSQLLALENSTNNIQPIAIGKYVYRWIFVMPSIPYHEQPISKSCDLLPIPWIKISHLFNDFMRAYPHYIFL
jgi:hypothetical protein